MDMEVASGKEDFTVFAKDCTQSLNLDNFYKTVDIFIKDTMYNDPV